MNSLLPGLMFVVGLASTLAYLPLQLNPALHWRGGWRLPSLFELTSLADTSQSDPTLPAGHPFENVVGPYWTATTSARDDSLAWIVAFRATFGPNERPKNLVEFVWCVRGGTPGPDKY